MRELINVKVVNHQNDEQPKYKKMEKKTNNLDLDLTL